MAKTTYTGASLEEAVNSGSFEQPAIELTGMVKASEYEDHIAFDRGGCENWVDLPTNLIERAEHLGQQPCRDHVHPVFRITLKESEDPAAQVFASLLATPTSIPPSSQYGPFSEQVWPGPTAPPVLGSQQGAAFRPSTAGVSPTYTPAQPVMRSFSPPWEGYPWEGAYPRKDWGEVAPCLPGACCKCSRYEWHIDRDGHSWGVCVENRCVPCNVCY